MKILFSCIGRRVELIQRFISAAKELETEVELYGADVTDTAPAVYFCDQYVKVCQISDSNYIDTLIDICRDNNIDLLIPTIDTDLLILSESSGRFTSVGTQVLISPTESIRLCRDKRLSALFFEKCGLKTPKTYDSRVAYSGGFPCFIKPIDGSSSIDAHKVNNEDELELFSKIMKNYIIQSYIQGKEYTVDVFCDFHGKPIYITPRIRLATRAGEVVKTEITHDVQAIDECHQLIQRFHPVGPITVQFIRESVSGEDYFIEINPRFGGGAPLSMKAGANSAKAVLQLMRGDILHEHTCAATDGEIYLRYDQSICPNINDSGRYDAVVFDLDDTLYSEKEYVKSGFFAVAELLTENGFYGAYERLVELFDLEDLNPLDTYLMERGIHSNQLLDSCLACYRSHDPSINLYPNILEVIIKLKGSGIKVGLLTDGRVEGQNAKINALGLRKWMDAIVITDALGGPYCRKPSDVGFRYIQKLLDVPFIRMLYIGDNFSKDSIAPMHLGMGFWYFNNPEGLKRSVRNHQNAITTSSQLIDRLDELCVAYTDSVK